MAIHHIHMLDEAMQGWGKALSEAAKSLRELRDLMNVHREQWLCEGEGQWPDKFTLLNRYVRTGLEPPFIFNR